MMDIKEKHSEEQKEELHSGLGQELSKIYDAFDDEVIVKAGEIIRNGGLVSFPTETVYGLGANALDIDAATSIFTTKERPMTDPLIVHISEKSEALELIDEEQSIIDVFNFLADSLWPGPLTCVMKANKDKISPVITADTGYVGIRCPNHEIALKLIREAKRPICAPSANKFGHVSPTKAEHVLDDFKANNVYILDGGQSNFGIESTVVKISKLSSPGDEKIHIRLLVLRRGGVSEKALSKVIAEYQASNSDYIFTVDAIEKKHFTEETQSIEAPGQFLRHYAPNLPSFMLCDEKSEVEGTPLNLSNCVVLDFNAQNIKLKDQVSLYLDLSERGDYIEAINKVYDFLRISETQEKGDMVIIANLMAGDYDSDDEVCHSEHRSALSDRLFRAVSGQAIKVNENYTSYSTTNL